MGDHQARVKTSGLHALKASASCVALLGRLVAPCCDHDGPSLQRRAVPDARRTRRRLPQREKNATADRCGELAGTPAEGRNSRSRRSQTFCQPENLCGSAIDRFASVRLMVVASPQSWNAGVRRPASRWNVGDLEPAIRVHNREPIHPPRCQHGHRGGTVTRPTITTLQVPA